MNDFTKGLIIGMMVVATAIIFIGAAQDNQVGRWVPINHEDSYSVVDTRTGAIARYTWMTSTWNITEGPIAKK